jgi:hypothetical protein
MYGYGGKLPLPLSVFVYSVEEPTLVVLAEISSLKVVLSLSVWQVEACHVSKAIGKMDGGSKYWRLVKLHRK